MNRIFKELLNLLLERYSFTINSGFVSEISARRTLVFGIKNAVELAYNCEDIGSAKVLQDHLKMLREHDVIPKPV